MKLGLQLRHGVKKFAEIGSPIAYRLQGAVPNQVTLIAYPLLFHENMRALMGLYVQDQWTIKRLTLGPGLRFDYENAYVPAQHLDAGGFVGARDFGEVDCVPCWKDLNPRLSAAYDLFGTGNTAVKFSVGRYTAEEILTTAHNNNPLLASNASATRAWHDDDHNYIPNCDFSNALGNGECGPLGNPNFGKVVTSNRYASDVLTENRPYNWATSVSLQHQLYPGVAINVGYYRTSWDNFTVPDAQNVTPADYTEFCVPLPNDALVPNAGRPLCGVYNVNPAKFGQDTTNLVTRLATGSYKDVYNGFDLTLNARLPRGAFVQGGLNTGRETWSSCDPVDSPSGSGGIVPQPAGYSASTLTATAVNPTAFCTVTPPFWHPQYKFSGNYPLPYGFQVAAVFQSLPGIPILANLVVPNSQVIGLGRPLAGGVANVTIANIIAPQTEFENRLNQLDVRFIRNLRVARVRIQGTLDIYNALNEAAVLTEVTQYGATWRRPGSVLDARIFKFGVQVNF